jgi:hypothetical protein
MKVDMRRVHELAKEMEGDYIARLALAFREAKREMEAVSAETTTETTKTTWEDKIAKTNEESAAKAVERKLPELEGSLKQIAWANSIRERKITEYEKYLKEYEEEGMYFERLKVKGILDLISSETKAKKFIEDYQSCFSPIFKFEEEFKAWERVRMSEARARINFIIKIAKKGE